MSEAVERDKALGGGLWTFGEASWVGDLSAEVVQSGGPDRVVYDDPCPNFAHRPVGFTAPTNELDPKRWEGDDS